MMWPYGFMGGWMGLWGILAVAFWAGVIILIVWAVRRMTGCGGYDRGHSPLDVAKGRYARGEISTEQFEQLKKDLS